MRISSLPVKAVSIFLAALTLAGAATAAPDETQTPQTRRGAEIASCLREAGVEIIAEEGGAVRLRMINAPEHPSDPEDAPGGVVAGETPRPAVTAGTVPALSDTPENWQACLYDSSIRN